MSYEINVALNGRHLFATNERSLKSKEEAVKCFDILRQKFPQSEGYNIMVYYDPGTRQCISNISDDEKTKDIFDMFK